MPPTPTSPRKAPRQERSRRTVERILDAAAHIFHEQGYAAATTNDIADEARVSIGSLYQYFPNKDALLAALTRRHIESATAGLADLLGRLRADAGFERILREVVDFLVEQHDLDRAKAQLIDLTSDLLSAAVEDQHRRSLVARMVVATIDAAVHDVIIRQPRGTSRRAAIDLTISTAMSIIEAATADQIPISHASDR